MASPYQPAMSREEIIIASTLIFQERGIKRTTMDYVSRKLGISNRALYEHFHSKRDLIIDCLKHNNVSDADRLLQIDNQGAIDIIISLYNYCYFLQSATTVILVNDLKELFTEHFNRFLTVPDKHIQTIKDRINNDQRSGLIREDINSDIIIYFFKRYIRAIINTNQKEATDIILIMLRGICTQKGVELVENRLNRVTR